ncbi:MAG: hypothetical protein LBS79_10910 [Tannerella sp.]|nr:hypothetical protein [Tannerella sp.]
MFKTKVASVRKETSSTPSQAEYEYINSTSVLTASIGGLIKVYNEIWLKPALNVVCDFTNGARFVPTLNLFYGLGYKKKR